jgi:hypothetical protein
MHQADQRGILGVRIQGRTVVIKNLVILGSRLHGMTTPGDFQAELRESMRKKIHPETKIS